MSIITYSKTSLIKNLKEVPLCVFEDIIASNKFNVVNGNLSKELTQKALERFSKRDKKINISIDFSKYSSKDYKEIAAYIGKEETWDLVNLKKAIKFIYNYLTNNLDIPSNLSKINLTRSNTNPEAFDATMLCDLCCKKGMLITFTTTINDMIKYITNSSLDSQLLLTKCFQLLQNKPREYLINLIMEDLDKLNENNFSFDETIFHQKIKRMLNPNVYAEFIPTDHHQAIFLAFHNYNFDITTSENPLWEYINLRSHKRSRKLLEEYNPVSDNLQKFFSLNRKAYQRKHFWNPKLADLYKQEDVEKVALYFNFPPEEIRLHGAINILNEFCISENFYRGYIPFNSTGERTPSESMFFKTPFEDVEPSRIITFGVYAEKLNFLTVDEIIKCIKSYDKLCLSADYPLTTSTIRRLQGICSEIIEENEMVGSNSSSSEIIAEEFRALKNLIIAIEQSEALRDENVKFLVRDFRKFDETQKKQIETFLTKIFEASMFMRGWKLSGNVYRYPLEKSDTITQGDMYKILENNVAVSLSNIKDFMISMDNEVREMVKKFPLVFYRSKTFTKSTSVDEGLTLLSRLSKIADYNDQFACIRSSSCVLASTVYFLQKEFGIDTVFDIDKLEI